MRNVGVVVNLDERTVSFLGSLARINEVNEAQIGFRTEFEFEAFSGTKMKESVDGTLDRVTGLLDARVTITDTTQSTARSSFHGM
jgi:hypothetical protein